MKKLVSLMLALCLACLMVSAVAEDSLVGTWYAHTVESNGQKIDAAGLGMNVTLTLNEDKTFTMDAMGTATNGTWTQDGNSLALTAQESTINATYADGTVTIQEGEMAMHLTREPVEALKMADPKTDATAEEYEGTWTTAYASVGGMTINADASPDMLATVVIKDGKMTITGEGTMGNLAGGVEIPLNFENGAMSYTMTAGTMSVSYNLAMLQDGMLSLTATVGDSLSLIIYCTKVVE